MRNFCGQSPMGHKHGCQVISLLLIVVANAEDAIRKTLGDLGVVRSCSGSLTRLY